MQERRLVYNMYKQKRKRAFFHLTCLERPSTSLLLEVLQEVSTSDAKEFKINFKLAAHGPVTISS